MRTLVPSVVAVLACAVPAVPAVGAVTGSASTAVGVGEREYRIAVYRPVVRRGTLRLNVTNRGEDAHDLAVLTSAGTPVATSEEVVPGGRSTLVVRLARTGRYTLICTKAEHAARGMVSHIRVAR